MKKRYVVGTIMGLSLLGFVGAAHALPVSTELLLLADVSGSLDTTDFELQRDGYANAFRSTAVQDAITTYGDIAVSLVYWSSSQSVAVDWFHIYDAASANEFADLIQAVSRPSSGSTAMAAAMNYGATLFGENDFESSRQVMDVSGDGADDSCWDTGDCPEVGAARDNALGLGVDTINALFIDDRDFFGDDPEDLVNAIAYGEDYVIAGSGAFVNLVQDYSDFEQAVTDKLVREITPTEPVPEPATMLLFGAGLAGLAGLRRKKA